MIPFVGLASGEGAANVGCRMGPFVIQKHFPLEVEWKAIITPDPLITNKWEQIAYLNEKLALESYSAAMKHPFTVVVGGDHSSAIGTWSGIVEARRAQGEEIGILWIDAHMDSHTPQTSESGNVHGMPLAALMGHGASSMTHILSSSPKFRPQEVFLVGIRSYEEAERKLLESLNVRIYYIEEVKERGLNSVLAEVVEEFRKRNIGYGISLDIDAFDPSFMSATGSPAENGLNPQEFLDSYSIFDSYPPVAFEYVEFNPVNDTKDQSLNWSIQILQRAVESRMLVPK